MRCHPSITFVNSVKTNKHLQKLFNIGSETILIFPYQTSWQYSDRDPLMGVSNADVMDKTGLEYMKIHLFVFYLVTSYNPQMSLRESFVDLV